VIDGGLDQHGGVQRGPASTRWHGHWGDCHTAFASAVARHGKVVPM